MFVKEVEVDNILVNLRDEELHLLPAEIDEGTGDNGSEDAREDEEEDDEAVLRLAVHPLSSLSLSLECLSFQSVRTYILNPSPGLRFYHLLGCKFTSLKFASAYYKN